MTSNLPEPRHSPAIAVSIVVGLVALSQAAPADVVKAYVDDSKSFLGDMFDAVSGNRGPLRSLAPYAIALLALALPMLVVVVGYDYFMDWRSARVSSAEAPAPTRSPSP